MSEKKDEAQFPMYKGKPLVRSGDVLYYGSMKDKYVCRLEIKSKKKVNLSLIHISEPTRH